jgi:hypothetical protein
LILLPPRAVADEDMARTRNEAFSNAGGKIAAMQINPYESPREISNPNRAQPAVPVHELVSLIVVPLAGIVGGALFIALMEATNSSLGSTGFQVALTCGCAATLSVLMAGDWFTRRQRPALVSAVFGMLLASPIAYVIAFALGLISYNLSTKNHPGAWLIGPLAFVSFFLTLSVGGWWAICRTRSMAVPKKRISI